MNSALANSRRPVGETSSNLRLESPDVRVFTRTIKLVVPRFSTTEVLVDEVRLAPEITRFTWSGVLDSDVMAIGNLADDEVTVTVRPVGRVSSEPVRCIMARDSDRYAIRTLESSPAVSARRTES